jgi:hypothetical protein
MAGNIRRRGVLTRLALAFRISSAALLFAAFVLEHHQLRWILVALAVGLAVVPVAWRRKGATVPGALYWSSADLLADGTRQKQYPGELSVTSTGLTWTPSRYSTSHGLAPVSIPTTACTAISMERGAALLDVIISARRVGGEESRFLTHWRPGLPRAIARLSASIVSYDHSM